ncbi:MAG: antibiotic biosynthesis monooxygenase [Cyanobacteria bacterium P01_D01_bin.115]
MTDFLDCLKHKYAYVAIGEFKPGCFSEARQLYEKAVSTYTDGFDGAYLLQEPDSDRGIAIILWDNPGDMEAHHNKIYTEALSKISHLFVEPPTTAFYEVCSEIMPMLAGVMAGAKSN